MQIYHALNEMNVDFRQKKTEDDNSRRNCASNNPGLIAFPSGLVSMYGLFKLQQTIEKQHAMTPFVLRCWWRLDYRV